MQCFIKKEDESLIDVDTFETTGEECVASELTNTIEQLIVYVHQNEAHFTYIYLYHTTVFETDNIYKNPSPKCNFTYIFSYFYTPVAADYLRIAAPW